MFPVFLKQLSIDILKKTTFLKNTGISGKKWIGSPFTTMLQPVRTWFCRAKASNYFWFALFSLKLYKIHRV